MRNLILGLDPFVYENPIPPFPYHYLDTQGLIVIEPFQT